MPALSLSEWALVATIISPLVTFLALLGVIFQVRASNRASDQSTATTYYANFLQRAMEHPEFVAPEPKVVNTIKEEFGGNKKEFRRYEVFVDLMLVTFDEMKRRFPTDKAADIYMSQWLGEHLAYLDSDYFKTAFSDPLSPELSGLMIKAIKVRQADAWEV